MRRGFTLLELLLVMAIVVAVTTLAIPLMSGPLENYRLRLAADQVRASWVRARAMAMEKGQTYAFDYMPWTGDYQVQPWLTGNDYLETDELVSMGITAEGESLAAAMPAKQETLPEKTFFVGSETAMDMRAETLASSTPDQLAAQPTYIYFYPDGTTSTARLIVANQRQRQVAISLRGLTGVVTVGPTEVQSSY
ncbi:MAG: Tfp pilus assembly protein FimT/FimU [Pirellulaceae bacterium]